MTTQTGSKRSRASMAARDGEEEDYMGDISAFLPADDPQYKKIASCKNRQPPQPEKPKLPKSLPWQERRRLEKERRQRAEDEKTRAALEVAIPETNVGFKMLRRMGYRPEEGRAEPVGIEIRRAREGIGVGEEKKRKEREVVERKRIREEEMESDFGCRRRLEWRSRRVAGDYRKAEAALAQLENREVEPVKEDEGEDQEEEEEEQQITEEDLHGLLLKLRDEYLYCLYCGCKYESMETMLNDCPGPHEEDH
ncbi:G patch domain-containing protein 11-like [Dioscorea cayenensis subsp. rotundata]|uniref:G patch domain-containing protein 11-like n=1 Tax=Dioscorea cayennensis subsp. rotundata TaxID=55577 RepID=A0AB40BGY2_DIOCR|nr:G patch domain-containing protein 11-like [Dioscorea cayenensis subsp. rotundata]